MQVVLIYLQPFRRNSILKCALHPKIAKSTLNPFLEGSRSFKVIDVDKSKKLVISVCYNKQHVCTYLQPFSHCKSQYRQNNLLGGIFPSFKRNSRTQGHEIFSRKSRDLETADGEDFVILACTVLIQITSVTDRRTDGRTDRRLQGAAKKWTPKVFRCFLGNRLVF